MQIERAIGDGTRFGLKVVYSQEARPLGVIGALRHAAPLLDDGFILQYGDALPELPTTLFARQARQRAEPSAMAVTAARHGRGNVEVSSRRVVRYDKTALLPWMDYGMLAFEKSLLFDYPSSTEGDLFPRLAAAGLTAAIETCLPVHTVDDERAYRAFERLVLSQPSRFSSPRSDSMRSATRRSEQG
jgi:NDP-sugar pyrophosphorylase family protein